MDYWKTMLFQEESKDVFDIKDLKSIFIGNHFNATAYNVPSNTSYVGVLNTWPSRVYQYGGDSGIYLNSTSNFLVKPNCPSYPNLHDALNSFLETEYDYHDSHVKGLQIILPNYGARIKTVNISEKNIDVEIEPREFKQDKLILKINARRDNEHFLPDDFKIEQNIMSVQFPFEPKSFYLFLVNLETEEIIDYIEYGNYMTSRHKGIVIKTSSELIEDMIVKGENRHIEFKQEMSDEFLESIAAFANTDGGKVILGVDNRQHVIGIYDDYTNLEKRIRGKIRSQIHPQIEVNVELIEIQQKPVVIVTVPEGTNKPYLQSGKLYVRNNEDDVPMGRSELDHIYHSKQPSENPFSRS